MKQLIIKSLIALVFLILYSDLGFAQGIRPDYTEMTDIERNALRNAYWLLGGDTDQNGPVSSLVAEIGDFHAEHFSLSTCNCPDPIHFNAQNLDVFLAWHRQTSVELERAMKDGMNNEWITIPYWDWTISNSKTDPLWSSDWIGLFDAAWNLGRYTSSSGGFPTQADIANALTETNFFNFSRWEVESSSIHVRGHTWTGNVMSSSDSPKDPAFFLHHNMVDKIWADWYELHGATGANYYQKTDMPRFDGTHVNALNQLLPSVDPDDIVDPRSLGIFYAENGLAVLDKYSVANLHTSDEKFGYKYTIEAKDDFIVPNGKSTTFKSCNEIILNPGFEADNGAKFEASIRTFNECLTTNNGAKIAQNGFSNSQAQSSPLRENVYATYENSNPFLEHTDIEVALSGQLKTSPNPFKHRTNLSFELEYDADIDLSIYDINGRKLKEIANGYLGKGKHEFSWNVATLPPGVYFAKLVYGDKVKTTRMIVLAK